MSFRDLSPEERALVQQQRFMTDLTHELRTPLAIVSGNQSACMLTMAREEIGSEACSSTPWKVNMAEKHSDGSWSFNTCARWRIKSSSSRSKRSEP